MTDDVKNMMLNDSKDLLDNVEITTIAVECVKLKQKEDEIAELEDQLKTKKASRYLQLAFLFVGEKIYSTILISDSISIACL